MLTKLSLYFHTLKYLKFKQIFFRLLYFFYKPTVSSDIKKNTIKEISNKLPHPFIAKKNNYFKNNTAIFLNKSATIPDKNGWNDDNQEKLWLYNLHYFDALNADDNDQQKIAYALLDRWVDENPPFLGIGWEPFPISLRIVNIIKYALSGNELSEKIKNSLYLQARFLNKKCEYHLLGNHLFENFKSLCMAGLFFDTKESKKWFQKAMRGLKKEIKAQVLSDGGHFELSPMYHSLFLEGLLDLQTIFKLHGKEFIWKKEVENMLQWLSVMKRSAQAISYFNDAANHIAETPDTLFQYAKNYGYQIQTKNNGLTNLSNSGFIIAKNKRFKLICDAGNIGPDYLPGHAHADTLSFELMVDEIPVFVNLGTSCYGNSERRLFERGTSAHNTVVINQKNSSEVWGAFRIAKRARIKKINCVENNDHFFIQAAHDGYKNNIHERTWKISENKIEITDQLNKSVNDAHAYFHLHPDCQIEPVLPGKIMIQLKNNIKIQFESENEFHILDNQYAESFGLLQKTKSIKIKLDSIYPVSIVKMIWK
ncbi:MAG: hypothetical protein ACD_29C00233G0002 [uncultured bacterium]|nr:MAG: hypothetical protein ACD_29C00233G0002 [uncultured bacterium]